MEKNIHFIWFDFNNGKTLQDFPTFIQNMEITKKLNPNANIILWNDKSALEAIENANLEETFKIRFLNYWNNKENWRYYIKRPDIFRYLIIYLQGGIYIDLDNVPLQSYDNLFKEKLVLAITNKDNPIKVGSQFHTELITDDFCGGHKGNLYFLELCNIILTEYERINQIEAYKNRVFRYVSRGYKMTNKYAKNWIKQNKEANYKILTLNRIDPINSGTEYFRQERAFTWYDLKGDKLDETGCFKKTKKSKITIY